MKGSSKRILSILLSGALFVATVVVYANFIKPAIEEVGDKRTLVFSKASAFENQTAAMTRAQSLIAKLRGAQKLQETVTLILPSKPNVTQVLNQLQAITKSSQAELRSFAISPLPFESSDRPLVKRLGILRLDASVEGSYEGVKSFLKALETNVRVFNVKDFKISSSRSASGGGSVADFFSGQVTADVYYQED